MSLLNPLKNGVGSRYFFLSGLCIAVLVLCFLIPPMQSPDEPSHLVRAVSLEKGFFLTKSSETPYLYGASIDTSLDEFMRLHEAIVAQHSKDGETKYTDTIRSQANLLSWGQEDVFRPAPAMAYYFPLIYAPQFVTLKMGELMGASISETYFYTRLVAALISMVLLFAAFLIYPPPTGVLYLLALPMALFQFASPTLDGLTLSLAIFGLSIYSLLASGFRSTSLEILLVASILLLCLARLHLFPLFFLILVLYFKNRSKLTLILFFFCLFIFFFWYWGVMGLNDAVAPAGRSAKSVVSEALVNPLTFLSVLYRTLTDSHQIAFLINSFIGNLGWLDAPLNPSIYFIFYLLLTLAFLMQLAFFNSHSTPRSKWLFTGIFISSSLIAFFALYVINTPKGSDLIIGMQGRYFYIPLAAFFYQFSSYNLGSEKRVFFANLKALFFLTFSLIVTLIALDNRYY